MTLFGLVSTWEPNIRYLYALRFMETFSMEMVFNAWSMIFNCVFTSFCREFTSMPEYQIALKSGMWCHLVQQKCPWVEICFIRYLIRMYTYILCDKIGRVKWGKMCHGVNKSTPFSQLLLFQSPQFFY